MGASHYISLERAIEGIDPLAVDGKAACRASDALESLATRLRVTPLIEFFSADPTEMAEFVDDLPPEALADAAPRTFHAAEDGLKTVRALCVHLRQNPKAIPAGDRVLGDLEEFEKILARAAKEGVRWHLAGDV